MTDDTMQMTAFEQRLARQLRNASSVALRDINPMDVARESHQAQGIGGWSVMPRWQRPTTQNLRRVAVIALLVLLLVATLVVLAVGPNLPQRVFVPPTGTPSPVESGFDIE